MNKVFFWIIGIILLFAIVVLGASVDPGTGLILFVIVVAAYFFGWRTFRNSLVIKQNEIDRASSSIDVLLKKRWDLLPNLVEVVKANSKYEGQTLEKITALRSQAKSMGATSDGKMELENTLASSMGRFFATIENYPELKANESFKNLQLTWFETEEQIAGARNYYNTAVTSYNNAVETFPGNLLAERMNYKVYPVLTIPEAEKANVSAKDLFKDFNV